MKSILRSSDGDEGIVEIFRKAFADKAKDGFEAKKRSAVKRVNISDIGRVSMTQIGG